MLGNFRRGNRSRQIFRNLGNNHIRLIDLNRIPDAQPQFLQNADIMQACTAHRRALQLHGVKHRNRVHQPRTRGVPFNPPQSGFRHFVRPFEGNGILGEFCRSAKALAIGNAVKGQHQSIGGNVVLLDFIAEFLHRSGNRFRRHHAVLHHIKAHFGKPSHIFRLAVRKGSACGMHQGKGNEFHISLCGNLAV